VNVLSQAHIQTQSINIKMKKENEDVLEIELSCKSGFEKNYKLSYENFSPANATYDKSKYPIVFSKDAKYFLDIFSNFHKNMNEVSFIYSNKILNIASQIDGEKDLKNMYRTKWKTSIDNFTEFQSNIENAIQTFNVKKLIHYLPYCELAQNDVIFYMNKQGQPVFIF
jgi:hypothetical protein